MGKRTIWREVGERECGRRGGGGGLLAAQASGSASPECAAQSPVTRLAELEGFPPLSEAHSLKGPEVLLFARQSKSKLYR